MISICFPRDVRKFCFTKLKMLITTYHTAVLWEVKLWETLLFIPSLKQPATLPLKVNLLSFLSLHLHFSHVKMNTFALG